MAETIRMPKLGFDMAEGKLIRWVKKVGETVAKGEVIAEIETDKANVEVEASQSGVVRRLVVDEGTSVPVGAPIAIVGSADEVIQEPALEVMAEQALPVQISTERLGSSKAVVRSEGKKPALSKPSPLARRMAIENKVDLTTIKGSGPGGRIVRRDVERSLAGGSTQSDQEVSGISGKPDRGLPIGLTPADDKVPQSKLRQAIARRMVAAKSGIPHFYVSHEYKMDALMDLRSQYNRIIPENKKLSVNDFIIKAAALALRQFPNLNASLDGITIIRHKEINIGVAVAVDDGLLTIVCRSADNKSLQQIAEEMKAMASRVRDGKVKPDDIEGSTFTVSNLGMYDVENFTAIINPPEAAILAVGSARQEAVVADGEINAGWRMKATISVDHRISAGVEAAEFMQALAIHLEEPLHLLL
jgi:pyruvate dehydrogenase E2 component (dihydrolipoamide acetyltransferase)